MTNLVQATTAKFALLAATPDLFIVADLNSPKNSVTNDLHNVMRDSAFLGFNPQEQHFMYADSTGEFTLVLRTERDYDYNFKHLFVKNLEQAKTYARAVIQSS